MSTDTLYIGGNMNSNIYLSTRSSDDGSHYATYEYNTSMIDNGVYSACLNLYTPDYSTSYIGAFALDTGTSTTFITYTSKSSVFMQCLDNYHDSTNKLSIIYKTTDSSGNVVTYIGIINEIFSSLTMSIRSITTDSNIMT